MRPVHSHTQVFGFSRKETFEAASNALGDFMEAAAAGGNPEDDAHPQQQVREQKEEQERRRRQLQQRGSAAGVELEDDEMYAAFMARRKSLVLTGDLKDFVGPSVLSNHNGSFIAVPTPHCFEDHEDGGAIGEYVGLFFGAAWSPPCRSFLPHLLKVYEELNQRRKRLQIIYVTCEQDEKAFRANFVQHPWMAMHLNEAMARGRALMRMLGVDDIPSVVVLQKVKGGLRVATKRGVKHALDDVAARKFPWEDWRDPASRLRRLYKSSKDRVVDGVVQRWRNARGGGQRGGGGGGGAGGGGGGGGHHHHHYHHHQGGKR